LLSPLFFSFSFCLHISLSSFTLVLFTEPKP
jgi:hypothetical protein